MQSAPHEVTQNATSVEISCDSTPPTQYGHLDLREQASDRLLEGDREPPNVLLDNSDALSVSSGSTSRGRHINTRRLSHQTASSHSSSPGSRIEEYERKHAKHRKPKDGLVFQVVPGKDQNAAHSIEAFPNGKVISM
jgi:hypothetical protein